MIFDENITLDPVDFFAFQLDCHPALPLKLEKKHILPDLSQFHGSDPFADVSMGWHGRGVTLSIVVKGAFQQPDFPNISRGDSIELFFDTRDVKSTGYNTRYCHHFFFLPTPFLAQEGRIEAGEISRFRNEEGHELCNPSLLQLTAQTTRKACTLDIFIPAECLYGYDPVQFDRLGFTYRINRIDGSRQTFSASDHDFTIESQPSLWASCKLKSV